MDKPSSTTPTLLEAVTIRSATTSTMANGSDVNNTSSNCKPIPIDQLRSYVFFQHTNITEKVFMFICIGIASWIFVDFFMSCLYVIRNYKTATIIKYQTLQILAIYPAVALSSVFSLFVPKSGLICELMVAVYMARAMFMFVNLMTHYFGGKRHQLKRLQDVKISLQSPPCCCCCCCLPKVDANEQNLRRLKFGVMQGFILQPIFNIIIIVLWLDGLYIPGEITTTNAFMYLQVPNTVSTLFSLYSYIVLYRSCRAHLAPLRIAGKFFSLQLVVIFSRLQGLIFNLLGVFNIPPCRGALSTGVLSNAYFNIIVIFEMFLLTQLARKAYRNPHEVLADITQIEEDGDDSGEEMKNCEANGHTTDIEKAPLASDVIDVQPSSGKMKHADSPESKI